MAGAWICWKLDNVYEGHILADQNQEPENSHIHAMLEPNSTYSQGIEKMRNYFVSKMVSFLSTNNYVTLGEALHCIQDAYSPPHNFKYWDGSIWSYIPHVFEGILPLCTERESAVNATREVYQNVVNSDGSNESIENIFDEWLEGYEN